MLNLLYAIYQIYGIYLLCFDLIRIIMDVVNLWVWSMGDFLSSVILKQTVWDSRGVRRTRGQDWRQPQTKLNPIFSFTFLFFLPLCLDDSLCCFFLDLHLWPIFTLNIFFARVIAENGGSSSCTGRKMRFGMQGVWFKAVSDKMWFSFSWSSFSAFISEIWSAQVFMKA